MTGSDALAEITTVSITGEPRIAQTLWFDFKGKAEKDQYIFVDYGDGVSNQNKVSPASGNWAVDWFHAYTRPGSYTVVVTEKNLAGEVVDRDTAFLTIDTSPISTGLIGGLWEVYEYRNVEGGRQPLSGMSMRFFGDGTYTFVGPPSEGFGAFASGAYRKELTDFLLVREGVGYPTLGE